MGLQCRSFLFKNLKSLTCIFNSLLLLLEPCYWWMINAQMNLSWCLSYTWNKGAYTLLGNQHNAGPHGGYYTHDQIYWFKLWNITMMPCLNEKLFIIIFHLNMTYLNVTIISSGSGKPAWRGNDRNNEIMWLGFWRIFTGYLHVIKCIFKILLVSKNTLLLPYAPPMALQSLSLD